MKFYLVILCFTITLANSAQEIIGNWYWLDNDGESQSEIFLSHSSSNKETLQGNYCSVFYNGEKVDCVEKETSYCLILSQVSTHIYEGSFQSFSHNGSGVLRLTYSPTEDSLYMEILNSQGAFYLPQNATFTK